ncbi:MAG: hypothetical protein JW761_13560 [Prolixibacteraceae bacterium]|nr:hypothetical protein [Prolixibacteraceae bacterium]
MPILTQPIWKYCLGCARFRTIAKKQSPGVEISGINLICNFILKAGICNHLKGKTKGENGSRKEERPVL